ncbi:Pr6Pr family membrane protein [Nocardia sp. NPDC005978]|uniref:Pr6Pr family membrane protein n=1 Tax=unclassified Nocardia TaxID=2637762 RepID=UPI0033B4D973
MSNAAGTPLWIRLLRLGFGAFGVFALAYGPIKGMDDPAYSVANYFSYFTILSNVIGVVVLLVGALRDPGDRRWQVVRGAATLYLVITGIVYALLLADIDVQLQEQWLNTYLHRIMPLVLLIDWLLVPAAITLSARLIGNWLVFPIVYGVYTLIRGPIVDWYPYPFIDPRERGYLAMSGGLALMVVFFVILALGVAVANGFVGKFFREARAS